MTIIAQSPQVISADLPEPLDPRWNRLPGILVEETTVTIDPAKYFFRFESHSWLLCDWRLVREELLSTEETTETAVEQLALDFVKTHGISTCDAGQVLVTAWNVYSFLFREEHLPSFGLPQVTADHLRGSPARRRRRQDAGRASRAGRSRAAERQYGAKFPKAVKKIVDDTDVLLAFYDYPAEHWIHLRTTNPIESTFSTVRLRTKVTRGAGSRAAALAMTFKLIESAQQRWRSVNAPYLVALVRAGARFERGVLVERDEVTAA